MRDEFGVLPQIFQPFFTYPVAVNLVLKGKDRFRTRRAVHPHKNDPWSVYIILRRRQQCTHTLASMNELSHAIIMNVGVVSTTRCYLVYGPPA